MSTSARKNKRTIVKFAKKVGLLYFGSIDKANDDCPIVRGFTVSSTHIDNSYCVGTFDGYDVSLVSRTDLVSQPSLPAIDCSWTIMTLKLRQTRDLPHIFIKSKQSDDRPYELFFDIFPIMHEVRLGAIEKYDNEFLSRFAVYAQPTHHIEVESVLPSAVTRILAAHLWPLSIEIYEDMLYVYSDSKVIDSHTLEKMLKDGLWLAAFLDK